MIQEFGEGQRTVLQLILTLSDPPPPPPPFRPDLWKTNSFPDLDPVIQSPIKLILSYRELWFKFNY